MVLRRHFYITIITLVLAGLMSSFQSELNLNKRHQKKIDKAIEKVWKDQQLGKTKITLSDSILMNHIIQNTVEIYRLDQERTFKGYLMIQKARGCKQGGCNEETCTIGECLPFKDEVSYEEFIYLVIYDHNLEIRNVRVIDYASEHGFEITNKSWLKQFQGSKGDGVMYGKDIDAISGATVSGESITASIRNAASLIEQIHYLDQSK